MDSRRADGAAHLLSLDINNCIYELKLKTNFVLDKGYTLGIPGIPVFLCVRLFAETHPQPSGAASSRRGCVDGKDGG